jgi:hypothetical protein
MYGIWVLFPDRGLSMFIISVALANAVSVGLAFIGENRHKVFARFLTMRVRRPAPSTTVP